MQDKKFQEILKTEYSLDDYEYKDIESHNDLKECPLCRKIFYPEGRNGSRQRYCKRTHVINCIICGTPIPQREASEKYGTVKFTCSPKCTSQAKIQNAKETMLEKYGTDNPLAVTEFKEKAANSIKAKSAETTIKIQNTMKEKYGGMGTASPVLRQKIENTMMERYGIGNPMESEEFRKKISDTHRNPEVITKYIENSRKKYGTDYPTQSEIVQNLMKETFMKKYGVEYSGQIPGTREKAMQTCLEVYGVTNCLNTPEAREKANQSMQQHRTGRSSLVNKRFMELLQSKGYSNIEEDYFIGGRFYDAVLLDRKIAFEIDPTYSHSTVLNHWNSSREPDYQLMKTEIADKNGFRCIHVFDWDNWEVVLSLIEESTSIYARKCKLISIDPSTADEFINFNHIQGNARGARYCYGLIYKGELVEVMTFGKSRYNKNYEWELLRLCTKHGLKVIGGASKMFKRFIEEAQPQSIVSYCDRAKFQGTVYMKLGMKLHHTSTPAQIWSKEDKYVTDNLLRQRGYDQLFNANYGKGTSNEQLMLEHGWLPVYDCGQFVFEWRSNPT